MQDRALDPKTSHSLKDLAPPKPDALAAAAPDSGPPLPRKFGRLTLLKPIAKGGMGEVFLATAGGIEGAERPCVVKIIRREHAEDPSFLARFFDEARIQAQLDHPGVARVLEAATGDDGKPFVVVEYIEGRNLAEVRNRGSQLHASIGWAEAVAIGVSLAESLAHIHERTDADGSPLGIVHRDLSPQNVMVGYGGDVKLIDFGTARGENRRCHTVSGVVLAKPGYVAPEVANNQPGGIPADLYALGIILWELVAGRRFLTGDASAHVAAVAAGRRNPPPIAELVKAPTALDTTIARLTAPRLEDRYASGRDVQADLLRVLQKAPSLGNGERGVRPRIAHLLERLYPAEPARSRAELARLITASRSTESEKVAPALSPAPSPHPAAADDTLFPGTRYRILREVGRGAMGVVYEAHHVDLGRVVALKVLPKERCQSPEMEMRFRREARAIARLRHPGLVHLHDFGVSADGRPYYAMELLEGETLERYLERERGMDWREAARVGIETLGALEAAHTAGLVHRDIKPGNLFLARDGRVKLLDFGIVQIAAEAEAEAAGETEALRFIGTAEYMAPEQAAGEAVDERADLYAVGSVLYELVTGRLPHVAPTTVALIDRKLRATPEPPCDRAPGRAIPRSLDRVIMRALARFPTQRYGSAVEMRAALEATLAGPAKARLLRRRVAGLAIALGAATLAFGAFRASGDPGVRARAFALLSPILPDHSPAPLAAPRTVAAPLDPAVATLYPSPAPSTDVAEVAPSEPTTGTEEGSGPAGNGAAPHDESDEASAEGDPSQALGAAMGEELARAEEAVKKGLTFRALHAYRALGKKHPENPLVLRGWAQAAIATEGWGEALRVAIRLASVDASPEAQLFLARTQRSVGQRYGAVATLNRLLSHHPDSQEATDLLAQMSEKKIASR